MSARGQCLGEQPVQILGQSLGRQTCAGRLGAHDDIDSGRDARQPVGEQAPQPTLDLVAEDRAADRLGHNKTDPRRTNRSRIGLLGVHHEKA